MTPILYDIPMKQLCAAQVWKRDTYRYTGGKHRFSMHYLRSQCSRTATKGDWCWQHEGGAIIRYKP